MTEKEFIEAFRLYNKGIFNFIFLRIGSCELAQDLTQEVFIKLWDNKHKFDPSKASIRTWLFKIARNHLIDSVRKNKKAMVALDVDFEIEDVEDNKDKALDLKFIYSKIKELNHNDQTLVILKYIEGLDNKEISIIINRNLNVTKVSITRALTKLKKLINFTKNEIQ